jgi:hypothetical protein
VCNDIAYMKIALFFYNRLLFVLYFYAGAQKMLIVWAPTRNKFHINKQAFLFAVANLTKVISAR